MKKLTYSLSAILLLTVIVSIACNTPKAKCLSCEGIYELEDSGILLVSPENIFNEIYVVQTDSMIVLMNIEIGLGADYLKICPKCEASPFLLNEENIIRFMEQNGFSKDSIEFTRQEIKNLKTEFLNNVA